MKVTIVNAPQCEPITLDEVYLHLRLTPSGSPPSHPDDTLLETFLAGSRQWAENYTHASFVQRQLRISQPGWEDLYLINGPVSAVLSVKYYDTNNALQTISVESYYMAEEHVPQVRFVTGTTKPALYDRPDAVRIEYLAGYVPSGSPVNDAALQSAVPEEIRTACLLGVQLLYDELSPDKRDRIEKARESLLWPYVRPVIA